jgi:hypothetical protein
MWRRIMSYLQNVRQVAAQRSRIGDKDAGMSAEAPLTSNSESRQYSVRFPLVIQKQLRPLSNGGATRLC